MATFQKVYSYIASFILSSVVLLVIGHYVIGLRESLLNPSSTGVDVRAYLPVYDNFPDREDLWQDIDTQYRTHFEPYVHWRRVSFKTKYINVEPNGLRRTIKNPDSNARKIFMMGGSTLWGTGSPDNMTIASLVQERVGPKYDVYNFGETGYVSAQELNQLIKELANGNIPDYVIFYDGNNDGYSGAYSPAIPRDPQNVRKEAEDQEKAKTERMHHLVSYVYENSNYPKLFWRLRANRLKQWDQTIQGKESELAKSTVRYYEAHIRQVQALAKDYGFKVYFFWQPNLFNPDRKPMSYEQEIISSASPVFVESQRQVYKEAKAKLQRRTQEGVFFIGDAFNEVSQPVYLDWSHTSPEGNKIIADTILAAIRGDIERQG